PWPLVVFGPESPVHAPTAIAGAGLAEQAFQGGPEIGRQWADCELHAVFVSVPPATPSSNGSRLLPGDFHAFRTPDSVPEELEETGASPTLLENVDRGRTHVVVGIHFVLFLQLIDEQLKVGVIDGAKQLTAILQ